MSAAQTIRIASGPKAVSLVCADIAAGVISAPALLLASGAYIRENCFRAQPTTSAIAGSEEANNRSGESFLRLIQDPFDIRCLCRNRARFVKSGAA
jgi:hypothetical protein